MKYILEYAKSFFNQDALEAFADLYLSKLPLDVTVLLSTGSSGCALATAMILRTKRNLGHIYIKKDSESSHKKTSGTWPETCVAAIVDDFIESGATIRHIYNISDLSHHIVPKYVIVHNCNIDYNPIWESIGVIFPPKLILIEEEEEF